MNLIKKIIIILVLFLLSCEREYDCIKCTERYYIDLFVLTEFWDTSYIYCDENLIEFHMSWYTQDTKGFYIHPLARIYVIKNCKGVK